MFYTPKLKQRQIIDYQLLIAVLFVVWEGICLKYNYTDYQLITKCKTLIMAYLFYTCYTLYLLK